jgi:hypothetical protein
MIADVKPEETACGHRLRFDSFSCRILGISMNFKRIFFFSLLLAISAPLAAEWDCQLTDNGQARSETAPCEPFSGSIIPSNELRAQGDGARGMPGASLTTLFANDNQFAGNTFDLEAFVDLTITGFDVNISDGTETTIAIYWRPGSSVGFESDPAGWTLLGTDSVTPAGEDVPTYVDIGGLALEAGQVYGIYVDVQSYPSASMLYTNGGPTTFSNADLSLTTQYGKGDPAFTGSNFFPRQWNGTIYYLAGEPVPALAVPVNGLTALLLLLTLMIATGVWHLRRN